MYDSLDIANLQDTCEQIVKNQDVPMSEYDRLAPFLLMVHYFRLLNTNISIINKNLADIITAQGG